MDSIYLEGLSESERKEMVKERVKELGNQTFTVTDKYGEKHLYDIDPIKKVAQAVKSATITTKNNIASSKPTVNSNSLKGTENFDLYTKAQLVDVNPIKKVARAVKSAAIATKNNIASSKPTVNSNSLKGTENFDLYTKAQPVDVNPIKMVARAVKSATIATENNIASSKPAVNSNSLKGTENFDLYTKAQLVVSVKNGYKYCLFELLICVIHLHLRNLQIIMLTKQRHAMNMCKIIIKECFMAKKEHIVTCVNCGSRFDANKRGTLYNRTSKKLLLMKQAKLIKVFKLKSMLLKNVLPVGRPFFSTVICSRFSKNCFL